MAAVWGVVVAAGRGRRFGGPKHEALLEGRPLWEWGRAALLEGGSEGVVVVGPVPEGVPGGERRRDSVEAGLAAVPHRAELVLVHDAARPLASAALVRRLLERLEAGEADGVVPGLPVRDALKRVEGEWVRESVEREHLVAVQTPQAFRASALRDAHLADREDASDDAALVERLGGRVAVIPGEVTNLKITFPEDLEVAARLLGLSRRQEVGR